MPEISSRSHDMPESPIRKLVPFAEMAKAKGVHVHHLNIGQPDIRTPEGVMEGLRKMDMEVIEYSHSAGFLSYREKLAKYYKRVGADITPEDVMVTTGGSEALIFAMQSCFDSGDEVIIPEPFYANYNGFAIQTGVNLVPVTARIEDNYALPEVSSFEELITPSTKGILLCNPANPTGYLYTEKELESLRILVKKYDLFLIADEVYREFCYGDAVPRSCLNLGGIEQNVIIIDSVSKRFSMCGARVGCLVTKNQSILASALKYGQARLSPPTLGQVAGELALGTPQAYFDEVNEEYDLRRNTLVDGLNTIPGVLCPKPKGAFYCMARLPVEDSEDFCRWILEQFQYSGATVMMAPAAGFYATAGKGKDEVRLAYVLSIESLKDSVEIIRHALQAYPGKKNQ